MQSSCGWSEVAGVAGAEGFRRSVIQPRFGWAPPAARSLGRDCIEFWEAHGGRLFEWQKLVIDGFLGLDENDQWVAANCGLNVARQNGKGVVLQALEVFAAFELGVDLVIHTAHEFATSQEHQLRLESFIQDSPSLHAMVKDKGGYRHANGQESINLKNGRRIAFKARTGGGGRGWSAGWLVWDEAMVVPDTVVGAQKPTTRATTAPHGRKTFYAGSAVDQDVHAYGVNFAIIRERGIERSGRVAYFEWSAPFDHPSELDDDALRNRSNWYAANPSMEEGLVAEETMADEVESMPTRTAAVELFGVGDWPRTDGLEDTVIDVKVWDALARSPEEAVLDEPYVGSFDVSPERHGSVAVSGRNQNDRFQTEIHDHRPGTGWMVDRIVEMNDRGLFEEWVCDGAGPGASLVLELKERGVNVRTLTATEHGQAWGRFVDMVNDGELEHLGDVVLRDAIRGAKPRTIGDGASAWGRRQSSVNIAPLVASTLGLGAAAGVASDLMPIY